MIDNFSNRPSAVLVIVTVPAPASITGGDVGLTGPAKAAHFHGPAAAGANSGVQIDIGKMGLASPMHGSATLTAEQETDVMAGMWYINIHTAKHPDGEIRGQVMPGM